jgi:hypothetical protein
LLPASKIKARRGTKISPIKGADFNEEGGLSKSIEKHVNESRTKSVQGLPNKLQSPAKNLNNESVFIINNNTNNSPGA